jgi:hypothetical protein
MRTALCCAFVGSLWVAALSGEARGQSATSGTESPWRFSLEGEYWYGHVSGFAQTPLGGERGTSSHNRPSFSELGINDASIYDVNLIAAFHNEELYAGGQIIRLSGDDTLDTDLISHGKAFTAGTRVSSDIDLDWYRFGYRHRFDVPQFDLTLWPSIGVGVLDFSYHLSGGGQSASRDYVKPTPLFGLESEWRPGGGPLSFDLKLLGSLPITPPLPEMFIEELTAKYRFIHNRGIDLSAYIGGAFEQIRYEDHQSMPNRIHADFGPMLVVGLEWQF